ncbi:MAG TPA: TetR/AcrR family transcriptional regulator [Steroidobacteraceae bacterium]
MNATTPIGKARAKGSPRSHNRIQPLLDAAAKHFADKGFRETTIRDISKSIGMLPGSVYYHFPSKERLLLAVYETGVIRVTARVEQASMMARTPWDRLERAITAHLNTVLDNSDYARVIIRVWPDQVPQLSQKLTRLRDRYESLFVGLISDLPVASNVNRSMFRLMLLGAMNWSQVWYRPSVDTPNKIAKEFLKMIRYATDSSA